MEAVGILLIILIFVMLYIPILALLLVSMWFIFTKAGQAGWKGIIPYYSNFVMLKFVGRPVWWGWIMVLPILLQIASLLTGFEYYTVIHEWPYIVSMTVVGIAVIALNLLSIVLVILMCLSLCDCFRVSRWFAPGLIFLPLIFLPVLAFGKYTYAAPGEGREMPQYNE